MAFAKSQYTFKILKQRIQIDYSYKLKLIYSKISVKNLICSLQINGEPLLERTACNRHFPRFSNIVVLYKQFIALYLNGSKITCPQSAGSFSFTPLCWQTPT